MGGPTAQTIRITHRSSGEIIAEGPLGLWGIMPFEGNLYISRKYLKTSHLRPNWMPGFCIYEFLFVWLDLRLPDGAHEPFIGWMYWLPNPLLPFIALRPARSSLFSSSERRGSCGLDRERKKRFRLSCV